MSSVLVYGAGAIGQWMAARLSVAGHAVTAVCRPAARDAIRLRGISVQRPHDPGASSLQASGVGAVSSLAELGSPASAFDWILVTLKAFDVEDAMEDLARSGLLAHPRTRLAGIQNGVGSEEEMARHVSPERVFVCVLTTPIDLGSEPAVVVEASARGGVAAAPYQAGIAVDDLLTLLEPTGLRVRPFADARPMKWSKLLLNIVANASCAILDYTPAELYGDYTLFRVERAALREAMRVMRALRISAVDLPGYPARKLSLAVRLLPRRIAWYVLRERVGAARGSKQPSLRLELERASARLEVDYLNGAVVEHGRRMAVDTPINAFLTNTLNAIALGTIPWNMYRRNPARFFLDCRKAAAGG